MRPNKILALCFFNVLFLAAVHLQAQTLNGFVKIEFNFLGGQKLYYVFPQSGPSKLVLEANNSKKILGSGDISAIGVNKDSKIGGSADPLVINGMAVEKMNIDGTNVTFARIGSHFYIVDNEGGVFPIPISANHIAWDNAWTFATFKKGTENFHVVMDTSGNGRVIGVVIRAKTNTYGMFNFDSTPSKPFDYDGFRLGFSEDGTISFLDRSGQQAVDSNGARLPSFSVQTLRPLPKLELTGEFEPATSGHKHPAETAQEQKPTQPQTQAQSQSQSQVSSKENLANIKQWLQKYIVGQPEVVQGLYSLEIKNEVYGYRREKPEVLMFMGLPGTGKDTAAETYVDAIYGQVGAHREHMWRLPILKREAELWSLEGSATGHVGSEEITPFIKWLVAHSGGRYQLVEPRNKDDGDPYVTENPEWKPGMVLEGYEPPEKAVLFANEFHNWSKMMKDVFLKQAMEKGFFQINNPGKGLSKLYVPVTVILASNEGINLLAPRKGNGERAGKALTYDQLLENWNTTHLNEQLLRREIMRTNGLQSGGDRIEESPGISEELLDRIPGPNIFLLRPLSPADLQEVIRQKLDNLRARFNNSLDIQFSDNMVRVLQAYQYDAEKNARPMEARVNKMIEDTLLKAIADGQLKIDRTTHTTLFLDLKKNPDKTMSLVVEGDESATLPILSTEGDRDVPLRTDAEIEATLNLGSRLKTQVFGADKVAEEVSKDIAVSEEGRQSQKDPEKATEPARSYMFLGPSSTGKTEMAKAIAREYLGSESNMTTYDFSQVRTVEDLKAKILGARDHLGNPVASDFMREYDAHQGRIVVVLDELANAPKDVLKALYDILREPVVRTFSDGVPRTMSNVILVMTGNAGEEWYQDIPRNIPAVEQQAAMEDIYKMAMADPDFRRKTLEKYFSEAFINRVGEQNIFFFSPLSFKAIRQLAQLKLLQALKRLQTGENRRSWNVVFNTKEDYVKMLETIENEGFVLREQGASIDRFVKQDIEGNLRYFLLANKVPNGATVVLRRADERFDKEHEYFEVRIAGQDKALYFSVDRRLTAFYPKINQEEQIITAFHEAGHELVRHVLMGDKFRSELITIIPGVTQIQDRWVRYLGVTKHEQEMHFQMTREAVIREMAVAAAGEVAQTLVTSGSVQDAGMSNDMERSTQLAQTAILKWGLSPVWGTESIPPGMTVQDYMSSLSAEKRKVYESELAKMIAEARGLAQSVLLSNMQNAFIPLALELAEKGTLDSDALNRFYADHDAQIDKVAYQRLANEPRELQKLSAKWTVPAQEKSMDGKISPKIPRPSSVANIDAMVQTKKAEELAEVALPGKLPVLETPLPALPAGAGVQPESGGNSGKTGGDPKLVPGNGSSCSTILNF